MIKITNKKIVVDLFVILIHLRTNVTVSYAFDDRNEISVVSQVGT
jgi:hypothetical protein